MGASSLTCTGTVDTTAMTTSGATVTVRLRYFDCRSRGQALRFALTDSMVEFDDQRVPIAELATFRKQAHRPEIGGPFASLPVLEWHGHVVAQTLAIANYLAAKLRGEHAAATPEQRSFLEMITSAAHLDMQVPYSQLLWLPADHPDEPLRSAARDLFEHIVIKLGQLEKLLSATVDPGPFFGGMQPVVADYFVYESLSRACDVFGAAFEKHLREAPRMDALRMAMDVRPAIAAYLQRGGVPSQVTASPSEPRLRQRLQPDLAL
jgi:glutathione S-transferase